MRRHRRRLGLILLIAVALGASVLTDAAFAQSKYKESPALAEAGQGRQAAAGGPAPARRSAGVPVVERVGQYGGVWRRAFLGPADANNYVRVVYDALVRHSPDGGKIEPKIAAGWESSKDFKQWTIKLRPGAKWSDGAPFTADDIVFWYQDVLLNKDLVPSVPSWMKNADGSTALVEKVSPTAVRFTFKQANTLVLTALANADGGDRTYAAFLPAHYLKKFHAGLRQEGRPRQARGRGRLQDLDRAVRRAQRAAREPRASHHGRLGTVEPDQRSGLHAEAESVLRRRRPERQSAARTWTRCASPSSPTSRR